MSKSYIVFPFLLIYFFGNSAAQGTIASGKFYISGFIPFKSGSATFDQPFIGGLNSTQLQSMDINNDGLMDILGFDKCDNKILPFIRVSGENFKYAPEYETYFPKGQYYYKCADINSDGRMDIFTLDDASSLSMYKNTTKVGDSFTSFTAYGPMFYRNQYDSTFFILFNGLALSKTDLPEISDIDGDGDLDIVTYDQTYQIYKEYRDVRVEKGWSKDTFEFQIMDVCFGYFNDFGSTITLGSCPTSVKYKMRHVGGASILMFDADEDGDKEMLLSNVGQKPMWFLENGRKDFKTDYDTMIFWDSIYPNNTQRATSYIFPAAYLVDVDGDGVQDMVTTPNGFIDVKETSQVWYYHNDGKNNKCDFKFVKDNFLIDKTIDLGARTAPAFFDYDADGDLDLFVAANGDFEVTGGHKDRIYLFQNIGKKDSAVFSLINSDFLSISNRGISDLTLAFGDLDGDKVGDLLLGEMRGILHFFKNTAGLGNPAVFTEVDSNLLKGQAIFGESNSMPAIYDYNTDGLPDLLVGNYSGNIALYKNTGTTGSPAFTKITSKAWGMKSNEWRNDINPAGFVSYGFSTPVLADPDHDGKIDVIIGSEYGKPRLYHIFGHDFTDSLVADDNWLWQKSLTDSMVPDFGARIIPAAADLDGDSIPEILFGNARGGLILAVTKGSKITKSNQKIALKPTFLLYPNPASERLTIERKNGMGDWDIEILDISGRVVKSAYLDRTESAVNIQLPKLSTGVYFVRIESSGGLAYAKVLIQGN